MLDSEKVAIAARLHVILRRKTGRVTDTEWMAHDTAYATEIVRFAREQAPKDDSGELALWAGKLEAAVMRPPASTRSTSSRGGPPSAPPMDSGNSQLPPDDDDNGPRYVWGIR